MNQRRKGAPKYMNQIFDQEHIDVLQELMDDVVFSTQVLRLAIEKQDGKATRKAWHNLCRAVSTELPRIGHLDLQEWLMQEGRFARKVR